MSFLSLLHIYIANSAEPNEMPYSVAFHLDIHCLPKYPFTFSNELKKKRNANRKVLKISTRHSLVLLL